MVTIKEQKTIGPNGLTYYYFTGESTDAKPTGEYPENSGLHVADGSVFYENDTGTRYEFNSDSETYKAIGSVEELPPVTAEDNGKVLSVVEGKWDKSVPTKELPAVTEDDNGEVLTVVDDVWATVGGEVLAPLNAHLPGGREAVNHSGHYIGYFERQSALSTSYEQVDKCCDGHCHQRQQGPHHDYQYVEYHYYHFFSLSLFAAKLHTPTDIWWQITSIYITTCKYRYIKWIFEIQNPILSHFFGRREHNWVSRFDFRFQFVYLHFGKLNLEL